MFSISGVAAYLASETSVIPVSHFGNFLSDTFDCTHELKFTHGVTFVESELPRVASSYLELNGDLTELPREARDFLNFLLRLSNDESYTCPPAVLLAQILSIDGIVLEVFEILRQWGADLS